MRSHILRGANSRFSLVHAQSGREKQDHSAPRSGLGRRRPVQTSAWYRTGPARTVCPAWMDKPGGDWRAKERIGSRTRGKDGEDHGGKDWGERMNRSTRQNPSRDVENRGSAEPPGKYLRLYWKFNPGVHRILNGEAGYRTAAWVLKYKWIVHLSSSA